MRAALALALATALLVAGDGIHGAPLHEAPAEERWYVDYDAALRALERSDWETAIEKLESAIRKNPRSSLNARTYGMRYISYVPYFYLGVSHYNLRRNEEALRYFAREEEAGQIRRSRDLAHQMEVLRDAAAGPTGPAAALAAADSAQRDRVREAIRLGEEALSAGRHREAYVTFSAVLAVEPENPRARVLRDSIRGTALAGELDAIEVRARGVAAAADTTAGARSEQAILESKAWELVRRGKEHLELGHPDSALARFDLALVLAADLPGVTQLAEEAGRHRRAAEAELRRVSEMRRQVEIAAAAPSADGKPRLAVVTPVDLEEEVVSELVTFQGTIIAPAGVARLEIEVNGSPYGQVTFGQRTRGIVVNAGSGAPAVDDGITRLHAQDSQGTIVDFYRDVALSRPVTRVVIRAHDLNGQVTEAVRIVRRSSAQPRVWAAIIGVAKYSQPGVSPLSYTVADAEAFARHLTEQLGVPRDQIFTLYDDEATTPRIRSVLGTELRRKAAKGDLVLVFFAGHGAPEPDAVNRDGDGFEKYLLSIESTLDDLYGSAISMDAIGDVFDRIPADRLVFIADACYSGAAGGRSIGTAHHARMSDRFLDRVAQPGRGRVVMAASSANELSQERSDLGHGVFTYYFLEALRGAGDVNRDGLITMDEAYRYVSMRVPEATGQLQHPVLKGEITGDLVLGRVAAGGTVARR